MKRGRDMAGRFGDFRYEPDNLRLILAVFDRIPEPDVYSYTVAVCACAKRGNGDAAMRLFMRMCEQGGKRHDLAEVAS